MDDSGLHHRVYLLRCWQEQREDPTAPAPWRFSLEALVAFLRRELRPAPAPNDADRRRGSRS